jgi:hypothetical protein
MTGQFLNASLPDPLDIGIPVVDREDFYNPEKQKQVINALYGTMIQIGFLQ